MRHFACPETLTAFVLTEIINAYNQWVKRLLSDLFTENVFSEPERRMIVDLAEHGITVSDLTSTLQKALKKHLEGETGQETDSISTVKSLEYIGDRLSIAYSIVFNLIFSVIKVEANQVGELRYDARLRSLAKNITARIFNITERLYTEAEALEAKKGIEAEAASELKGVSDEVATEATETTGAATIEASEEHNGDGDGDADSGIESVDDGKNAAADPQDEQDVSTDIDRLSVDSQEKKWKIRSLFQQDVERLVAEETRKAFPWMSVVRPVSYCFTEANFEVVPLTPQRRSIHCILAVSGWLHAGEKLKEAWSSLLGICPFSEVDMIMFDRNQLIQISNAIRDFMATGGTYVPEDELTKQSKMTSLTTKTMWPRSLLDMSYLVDKPWKAALARTEAAGIVLAKNLLMGPVRGTRPVTLVGWGLGARVIYHCLLEMVGHARADGPNPWGIIDSVYMLGCPVEVAGKDMIDITTLVSDRFVNVFSHKDWFLQFLSRNLSPSAALFGLRPVSARGAGPAIAEGTRIKLGRIENYEVSDIVHRHLDYQEELPTILQRIGFDRDSYEASTVVTVGPPA
ncbi:uncharacterized protein BJ171DRAFT_456078 [Polychytrium aggregatum]|uniref:uncharacterized protein n=1 Tax=Polychytrium aggregatum TaxID=110093 RepID=UPI0022FEEBBA|nr:uncharacterized protein BJ171DRAFT_456078 [Polychytrium aggregatum]KAI9207466.1 hypothetical protein BJ171DRAFT_456078 [Polychytrium aggregatum]